MTESESNTTYEYEERFVAFIDILGFKQSILNDKIETLIRIIQQLRSEAENKPYVIEKDSHMLFLAGPGEDKASDKFHSTREISVFSDLIAISYPVHNDISTLNNLHKLLHSIYLMQEHLTNNSILIRGGVSCGLLYHRGDICIGPALIRAYDLEQNVAKFPRVIIDPLLLEQTRFKGIIGRWPDYLEKYGDEFYFITHFRPLKTFFDIFPKTDLSVQIKTRKFMIRQRLLANKIAIDHALKSSSESTKEKGRWLNQQYQETVRYFETFYDFTPEERRYIDIGD